MISNKSEYLKYLYEDKKALGVNGLKAYLFCPIWKFQRLLRKLEYYKNCKRGFFSKIYCYFLSYKFISMSIKLGFSIYPNCFDYGLNIAHYGDIVVNGNAKIGKYCRIHSGVCIGEINGVSPRIYDRVYIGPGVKILGNVTIFNDNAIAANSVVLNTFNQEGVTLGGIPAKVISNKGSINLIKH